MENQEQVSPQPQPATIQTPSLSPSSEPSHAKNVWKIVSVVLISTVVVFSLLAWYGFHLEKQGSDVSIATQNSGIPLSTLQEGEVVWDDGQTHVFVETTKNAYTLYMSIPPETPEQKVRDFIEKDKVNGTKLYVLPLDQFMSSSASHIEKRIVKNEYPEVDVAQGITLFLKEFPGAPIAVTWNGGVAFTNNDYTYAEKIYDEYLKNPAGNFRPADRNADPLHPLNHFEPLLNQ